MKFDYDVFISFADEDKIFASELYEALQAAGIKAWCSAKDVPLGVDIHASVSRALPNCEYFLPIIGRNYGRFWHEKEFHSASHNRPNALIIPVSYYTDYEYLKTNEMFSLISSIRLVNAEEMSMPSLAKCIAARINKEEVKVKPQISAKMIFYEKIVHNRIAQIVFAASLLCFAGMRIYDYISKQENLKAQNALDQRRSDLTDTLTLVGKFIIKPSALLTIDLTTGRAEDDFPLELQNVAAEKQKNGLQKLYFTISNKSEQSLFFNTLILEVTRQRSEVAFKEKVIDIETIDIWEVAIPQDTENVRYKYRKSKAPKKMLEKDQTDNLCLILYQQEGKKRRLPPPYTMRATFVSSEKTEVSSKQFLFSKKGEFVYEH